MTLPNTNFKKNPMLSAKKQEDRVGNIEIESSVLAAILLERNALDRVIDKLTPDLFGLDFHRVIFEAIIKLYEAKSDIDLQTVCNELRKNNLLEYVGGVQFVVSLTTLVNSAYHIETHVLILSEYNIRRSMILAAEQIIDAAKNDPDALLALDNALSKLLNIGESTIKQETVELKTVFEEAMNELHSNLGKSDGITGVPSGLLTLDRFTSGWQKQNLIILAARPGMGKTTAVLKMAMEAAKMNYSIAVFSLEMSSIELTKKLIAKEARIDSRKMRSGLVTEDELYDVMSIADSFAIPLYLNDTAGLSIMEFRKQARKLKREKDVKLIIIDYLQLMQGDPKSGNREQEVSNITKSLKQLAKELDIPIIVLSQLSRAVETRGGDKRPMLSDLRESGGIEQDSDQVIFLYRPEYYQITEDAEGYPTDGLIEFIFAKFRNGSLGTIKLKFDAAYSDIFDFEASLENNSNF